jgi:hypothetical protein
MTGPIRVAVILAILLTSIHANGEDAISISVRPSVTTARGNAQLRVLIARDQKNRALIWEVDGPSFYRSSTIELDGASSPRSYLFMVRELPAGEFEVRATVRRNDSSVAIDRGTIRVVGGPG